MKYFKLVLVTVSLISCLIALQATTVQAGEIPCNGCYTRITVFNPGSPKYVDLMFGTDGMVYRVCQITPGPNQGLYTIHWCLCNAPVHGDACLYTTTTSNDEDDDDKQYADPGCGFDSGVPPSSTTCKLRVGIGIGCHWP